MEFLSVTNASLVAVAICVSYKLLVQPLFVSPLSKIPSAHRSAHISPFWIYYVRYTDTENQTLYELHKKKGPILRLAPNELSINCYEQGLKTVYTGGFDKTEFYFRRFANYDGVTNLFSMVDSKSHSRRKRMLSNVYAKSYVLASPTTSEITKRIIYDRLLPLFQYSVKHENPIEMLSLSYAYAMDFFTSYQYGMSLASNFIQDTAAREWFLKCFFAKRPYMFWAVEVPNFSSLIEKIGIKLMPRWTDKAVKDLENWSLEICDRAEEMLEKDVPPKLRAICIATALRLWPAVPGGQPRVTPYPSCTLAGYDNIPPGVRVQASTYSIHKNPEVFPRPGEWKPERWLEANSKQLHEMRRWFWAWGSVGRMCIGSNVAIHTMKFAIASIYTNVSSEIVDADSIELAEGYTAGPKGNKLVLQYRRI